MPRFLIVIEKADRNFAAYSSDILGCVSTGKTPEDTKENMREAIKLHLGWLLEDGLPIPTPQTQIEYIDLPDEEIMSVSEEIRAYAYKNYIEPARKQGVDKVKIRARDVHKALGLRNSIPLVCQAIRSPLFENSYGVRLIDKEKPSSVQRSKLVLTFAIEDN